MQSERVYRDTASGFNAAASRYDAEEAGNVVLARMRAEHSRWFERAFPKGGRLIELGSGTGVEAAELAGTGRKIALVDVAASMLEQASGRVREVEPTALLGSHALPAAQVGQLAEVYGAASFDGAYSSFGPLNCEPDLRPVAQGLAKLVKPGGRLVFSVMPKFCLSEIAWFALHLEFRNATRRLRKSVMARALPGQELLVETFYYNPGQFRKAFAPEFRQVRVKAFPLLWPPPYLAHLPKGWPGLFKQLGRADDFVTNRLPGLAMFGDHFLIELERA